MNQQRLLDRFLRYVRCSSESQHEREFCLLLEGELEALHIPFVRDLPAGEACGSDGWNLQVFLPGTGDPILLSSHMDTVTPGVGVEPVIRDGVVYSAGDTVLGGDDKSGVAAIMETLETAVESDRPHRPVEVLFTVCEEKGLKGSEHADFSLFQSKEALVLDSSQVGKIVNRSTDNGRIRFVFDGTDAVTDDEQFGGGLRALKAAARAVNRIACGQVDGDSIVQIADFSAIGHRKTGEKKASFEVIFHSYDTALQAQWFETVEQTVREAAEAFGVAYEKTVLKNYRGLKAPADLPLIGKLQQILADMGEAPAELASGTGGCDASWIVAHGIDAVNIGTGMSNIHTPDEYLPIDQMERAARLAEGMIYKLD
jgi:tripeptide aminopeptidase